MCPTIQYRRRPLRGPRSFIARSYATNSNACIWAPSRAPAGSFRQRTELTPAVKKTIAALGLPEPRRVTQMAQQFLPDHLEKDQPPHPAGGFHELLGRVPVRPPPQPRSAPHRECASLIAGTPPACAYRARTANQTTPDLRTATCGPWGTWPPRPDHSDHCQTHHRLWKHRDPARRLPSERVHWYTIQLPEQARVRVMNDVDDPRSMMEAPITTGGQLQPGQVISMADSALVDQPSPLSPPRSQESASLRLPAHLSRASNVK